MQPTVTWNLLVESGRQMGAIAPVLPEKTTIGAGIECDIVLIDLAGLGSISIDSSNRQLKFENNTNENIQIDKLEVAPRVATESLHRNNSINVTVGEVQLTISRVRPVSRYEIAVDKKLSHEDIDNEEDEDATTSSLTSKAALRDRSGPTKSTWVLGVSVLLTVGLASYFFYPRETKMESQTRVEQSQATKRVELTKEFGVQWRAAKDGRWYAILAKSSERASQRFAELQANRFLPLAGVFVHDLDAINRALTIDFAEPRLRVRRTNEGLIELQGTYSSERRFDAVRSFIADTVGLPFFKTGTIEAQAKETAARDASWLKGGSIVTTTGDINFLRTSDGNAVFEGAVIEGHGKLLSIKDGVVVMQDNLGKIYELQTR
jgi:hypothetical protein